MNDKTAFEKYQDLFDEKAKESAFDKLAALYYDRNFGSLSKSDFDVLMFSIYLEQILNKHEEDYNQYSDYELAKILGITQSKVRGLKEKKQLKYPYEGFNWKESFKRVCENSLFDSGKFVIELRDRNLYLEVKNHIETHGGYVENALSGTLLKVSPEYYIQLLAEIYGGNGSIKEIKKRLKEKTNTKAFDDESSLSNNIKNVAFDIGKDVLIDIIGLALPNVSKILAKIIDEIFSRKETVK